MGYFLSFLAILFSSASIYGWWWAVAITLGSMVLTVLILSW